MVSYEQVVFLLVYLEGLLHCARMIWAVWAVLNVFTRGLPVNKAENVCVVVIFKN